MDNISPEQRHTAMKNVKSLNTKPELIVRKLLCSIGERGYRLNRKDIYGKPDIAYLSKKKAIFINGCFWHGHTCSLGQKVPKTNTEYWIQKIMRNQKRDSSVINTLQSCGWNILVIWECDIKNLEKIKSLLKEFLDKKD